MTHAEFCHWLNGYYKLSNNLLLDERKLNIINNHLALAETVSGEVTGDLVQIKTKLALMLRSPQAISLNDSVFISQLTDSILARHLDEQSGANTR
jgi:hypothetical protein